MDIFSTGEQDFKEPNLYDAKDILKRLVEIQIADESSVFDTSSIKLDERKLLRSDIKDFNYALFSKRKMETKTFTVCNSTFLKKLSVGEDADGVGDGKLAQIYEILEKDEAFYDIVAKCIISKAKPKYPTDNHLFYAKLKSKHTSEREDIYFVHKEDNFYVVLDKATQYNLLSYIDDFIGNVDETLKSQLHRIGEDVTSAHIHIQKSLNSIFEEYEKGNDEHALQYGVISFFDFLGWKGLWLSGDRSPLRDVTKMLDEFRKYIKKETKQIIPMANGMMISRLISISDTIAIFTPQVSSVTQYELLELHAKIARFIVEKTFLEKYPIRGAITYGQYNLLNNVMIGPGIDECASWHEKCDWIGVHFTPSSQFILNNATINNSDYISDKKKIPLKGGLPPLKYSVLWNVNKAQFQEVTNSVKSLLPEIASKYLNTYKFIFGDGEEETHGSNGIS